MMGSSLVTIPKRLAVFILITLLASLTLNLFAAFLQLRLIHGVHYTTSRPKPGASYSYFGDDYPAELPLPKPLQEVALSVEDPTLHYRINNTADWVSIFPKKHGFVRLGPEGRYFAVSMYHQLHCLNGLRRTLLASAPGRHQVMGEKVEDLHTMWLHEHTEHCLNFIRQALLCKADTTLEAAEYVRNPHGQLDWGANGLGMVHRCHDWTQVRDAVERNEQEWEARVIN